MTRPIPPRQLRPQLPLAAYRWLLAGQRSAWYYLELNDPATQRLFWEQYCDAVVAHHIKRHPGTRPKMWWRLSSPGPRRRVGGIGTPLHECSSYALNLEYGVPTDWRTAGDYLLRAGTPISDTDPPLYESEAAYLRRHDLFRHGERSRLSRRSYEPCVLLHHAGRYELLSHDLFKRRREIEFERIGSLRALLNVSLD